MYICTDATLHDCKKEANFIFIKIFYMENIILFLFFHNVENLELNCFLFACLSYVFWKHLLNKLDKVIVGRNVVKMRFVCLAGRYEWNKLLQAFVCAFLPPISESKKNSLIKQSRDNRNNRSRLPFVSI